MSDTETPEREAARRARSAQAAVVARAAEAEKNPAALPAIPPPAIPDPLHLCVYTTVALLAWAFSPALVAAVFAFAGLRGYLRAWRAGLRRSDCILRDPRLVMLYLGLTGVAGLGYAIWRVAVWLGR
jgi:hypothetical protein